LAARAALWQHALHALPEGRPGPFCASSFLICSMSLPFRTFSPVSSAVSESCTSRSLRSVTTTILKRRSAGSERILRTRNTMVRLLPEPCAACPRPAGADDGKSMLPVMVFQPMSAS
jgi:hypothetical protein